MFLKDEMTPILHVDSTSTDRINNILNDRVCRYIYIHITTEKSTGTRWQQN